MDVDTQTTDEEAPGDVTGVEGVDALEAINILPLLLREQKDWIEKEARNVVARAKEDNDSRKDFMDRYANQLRLFAGLIPDLGYPAQGSKAPHIATMCKSLLHLWSRIYDQVVPAKGDIVKCKPLGPADEPRAIRVERHINWQLRHRMPDWGTSQQVSILAWLMAGSTFRHYRWDPIAHTHAIDHVPIDDIIVSYTEDDVHPQMKNVERVTRVLRLARWQMEVYQETGHWSNLDAVFPPDEDGSTTDGDTSPSPSYGDNPDSKVRDVADKIQGVEPTEHKTKYAKREVYEQHTRLTFPKKLSVEGLAGVTKPVIITVDKQTRKPVGVTLREEPDPIDQARFDQEMQAYELALQNQQQQMAAMDPALALAEPELPKAPRPVRMQTIYNIIHIRLFPNPSGFYGLGVGYLLEGSNELANVLAAEYMLSARFYNMFCGFLARGTKEKRGDLQIAMGKFMETDLEPELLDKGIKVLQAHPPADGLMKVVDKLEQNSEIAVSADILSGEKGTSNETARGMMVRNSNAMALISVMTRIYLDPLKYELKLVAHGNSVYLDEAEYFPFTEDVSGEPGKQQVKREMIGRADYIEDVHLEFTADARMVSKPERVADAKDFVMMILNSPMVQNPMLVDFSFRKLFTVAEAPDYVAAMGPPPPPPQPPPPPTPEAQEVENAKFMNEEDHPVLPDDNHEEHLMKIQEFRASPFHQKMSSTGKQILDRHERAHMSSLYLQLAQAGLVPTTEGSNEGAPLAGGGGEGRMEPGQPGGEAPSPFGVPDVGGGGPPSDFGANGSP